VTFTLKEIVGYFIVIRINIIGNTILVRSLLIVFMALQLIFVSTGSVVSSSMVGENIRYGSGAVRGVEFFGSSTFQVRGSVLNQIEGMLLFGGAVLPKTGGVLGLIISAVIAIIVAITEFVFFVVVWVGACKLICVTVS